MSKKTKKVAPIISVEPILKEKEFSVSFFDTLNKKAIYITLSIVILIAFFVFKDFLLSKKVYLFRDIGSDTLNANLPYLSLVLNYFHKYGTLSWSFSNGMGQSIFPFFLRDPFDLIVFAGGAENIYYLLGFKEFIKIIIVAVIFYFYLDKLSLNNFTKITGTLLFSFCGFMIVGSGWYVFSYETINFALLLLGFELLFQNNKGLLFSLGTFLFAASMPFNLYVYGLFIAMYGVLRYYFNSTELKLNEIISLYSKMAIYGIIGICLAGPLLLENIHQILESPRGSGENSYFHQLVSMPMFELSNKVELGTSVMRFFSSDIIGTGNNFKGWGNTLEAPLFYCGLPCLLLLPQLFGFLNKKQIVVFSLFLAIWFLPIIFPYFRRAFWLFSGDYYRSYSLFVSLCFLIYSLMALDSIIKNKKINMIVLGITLVALYALLSYSYFGSRSPVVSSIGLFVKIFIAAYALILILITKSKNINPPLILFLSLVCIELFYFTNTSINKREAVKTPELTEKIGYNDYTVEAVNFIHSKDSSFYRIDKNYFSSSAMHGSLNDAMVQNYYGTTCYNGFSEKGYIDYLKNYNIISQTNETEARWAGGLNNRLILESLNSVKYLFLKNNQNPMVKYSSDSIARFGDVTVFKNKYNLPLGICYDRYVKGADFKKLTPFQKDGVSLKAAIIDDNEVLELKDIHAFNLNDTISAQNFSWEKYADMISKLKADTLTIQSFKESEIKGNITISEPKIMYLSIPNDKGWIIKINGNEIKPLIISQGMIGLPLLKGKSSIEMEFKHLYIGKGIVLSIIAFIALIIMILLSRKVVVK